MDLLFGLVIAGLSLLVVAVVIIMETPTAAADPVVPRVDWAGAARELGLSPDGRDRFVGRRHERIVSMQADVRSDDIRTTRLTRVTVSLSGLGKGLGIGPARAGRDSTKIGDARFDLVAEARGEPLLRLALLDDDTRGEVTELVRAGSLSLVDGELTASFPGQPPATLPLVKRLLALAERLDPRSLDFEEKLAANVTTGRLDHNRAACLRALAAHAPTNPGTLVAARSCLAGSTGELRAVAFRALAVGGGPEVLEHLFDEALESGSRADLLAANALVVERRAVHLLGRVARAAQHADETVARSAVEALASFDTDLSRGALADALRRPEDSLQAAAAEALGAIGLLADVELLHEVAGRFLEGGQVKVAARDAIRRIQARAGPADAGRLTVQEDPSDAGRLALVDDGGDLALVEEPAAGGSKVRG